MKVLIDVNVALDVILERQPWLDDSKKVWDACHEARVVGHLIATAVTNIFYVSRRLIGTEKARAAVRICLVTFEIIPVGRDELEEADSMAGSDLEDNVSLACALAAGLDAIVTRDPRGFAGSPVPVLSPAELLAQLPKDEPEGADPAQGPSGRSDDAEMPAGSDGGR
jgi:predicted nucleic acid-binding protein